MELTEFNKVSETADIKVKGFYVYKGLCKKSFELLYIGTTTQIPSDRFRWHKANGKDFIFEIIKICNNEFEMLDCEYELIQKYKPKYNKINKRKQNFNKKLTSAQKLERVNVKEWCQSCLTRRVNSGYKYCAFCN